MFNVAACVDDERLYSGDRNLCCFMLQVMSQLLTDLLATKEYDLSVSHEEAFLDIGPSDERIQALRVHLMAALMQYTSTDRDWAYFGRHAYRPILQHFADVTQAWRINGLPGLATPSLDENFALECEVCRGYR